MTPPAPAPGDADPTQSDPMLRVLRERHPEVDVIVLPQPAAPAPAPVLDSSQREALAADVETALGDLLTRLGPAAAAAGRDGRWHRDEWGRTWYESAALVRDLAPGANVDLLRSTGHALTGLGWQARPVPGDRPRLVARRRGGLEASATVRPTSLVVTVRTVAVQPAAEEDAR